jgi:hypothetical protein
MTMSLYDCRKQEEKKGKGCISIKFSTKSNRYLPKPGCPPYLATRISVPVLVFVARGELIRELRLVKQGSTPLVGIILSKKRTG